MAEEPAPATFALRSLTNRTYWLHAGPDDLLVVEGRTADATPVYDVYAPTAVLDAGTTAERHPGVAAKVRAQRRSWVYVRVGYTALREMGLRAGTAAAPASTDASYLP